MAAVRRLAYEAADYGLLSPELAAGIHRVKGVFASWALAWATGLQLARRRRSGSYPMANLFRGSVIELYWPSCSVADCAGASSQS
jgi:hypothetical protein